MVLLNSGLREYLQPVLTCLETESLLTAVNLCQQCNSEWVVVLDQQQCPKGCIALSRLSRYLLESISVKVGGELSPDFDQVAQVRLQAVLPDLATGLITVPEGLTLLDILPFLQHRIPVSVIALVNAEGEFLGLVDEQRLLQKLATYASQPNVIAAPGQPVTGSETKRTTLTSHQSRVTQLTQQLLAQKSEFELRLRSQQQIIEYLLKDSTSNPLWSSDETENLMLVTENQGTAPLLSMQALLECLPLPFMLQTSDGRVLVQNAIWRQEFEALRDPITIRRDAGSVLANSIDPMLDQEKVILNQPSFCELGSQPDSCICTCLLKDGRERIVQFVKVYLGHLVASDTFHASAVVHSPPRSSQLASAGFHLANLNSDLPASSSTLTSLRTPEVRVELSTAKPFLSQPLWLILAQDITEQHQLASDLTAKNADLMQLNRLKDEFLACISHELRTPLTAVLGLSTLLSDQTLGPLNDRQARYADLIHQSGRHLMAVVNDIMDLTRVETGQLTLTFDQVDLSMVCEQAFQQAKQKQRLAESNSEVTQQNISFTLDLEPGLTTIVADELRLRQMLENLLSNAFKFTEVTHTIGLKVNRWGGWIAFTVWDTGIGIPNDQQHLIFQKFQQLESPLTRRFEGTGLGLVLTQRLARLHGGDISFLSQEGKGSQFTILLPSQPPAEVLLPSRDRPLESNSIPVRQPTNTTVDRNRLVLIVEAVPHFIDRLSTQLISLGYRVLVARSGTEALEKTRRLQPGMIFLNPLLPMLSGWDVLTLLKTSADTHSIPVVVTATPVDEEQANRCHADGFLQIPIQTDLLRQVIGHLIAQQSKAQPQSSDLSRPLTLLRLDVADLSHASEAVDFNQVLQGYQYRLLEADDLEQAELLARVWHPDLILLNGSPPDWLAFLQTLRLYTMLASRPLLTLDALAQSAAHQVPGLTIFSRPVATENSQILEVNQIESCWLRLIQLAIGYIWQPLILTIDSTLWSDQSAALQRERLCETEWAHALIQYLLTAGLRGCISESRQEAMDLLQSGTVDLLLISWTDNPSEAAIEPIRQVLNQLNPRPPLLVLDHRSYESSPSHSTLLSESMGQIADRILPATLPMAELLEEVQTLLSQAESLSKKNGVTAYPGQVKTDPG